jgi:hypothetical protein
MISRACVNKIDISLETGVMLRNWYMFMRLLKANLTNMIQQLNILSIGLHFYYAVIQFDHFTGRRLSLTSCVPPAIGQPDNVDVLPSTDQQRLERSSIGSGAVVSKAKKRGVQQTYSEANSTASASSSSFSHTVQLVSQNKEDEELAHIKEHVISIKDAISTLENLDTAGYAEEHGDLRKQLALADIIKFG